MQVEILKSSKVETATVDTDHKGNYPDIQTVPERNEIQTHGIGKRNAVPKTGTRNRAGIP